MVRRATTLNIAINEPLETTNLISENINLEDLQIYGLVRALTEKRALISYDTGLGKTIISSVLIRALLNKDPSKKHLFVITHDQLMETPQVIASIVEAPVICTSAGASDIRKFYDKYHTASVIIMSYECFRDSFLMTFLYSKMADFQSIIIDEAHIASNWNQNDTAFMIRSLSQYFEYCIGLTATPIISDVHQFSRLRNLIDRSINYKYSEDVSSDDDFFKAYIKINRKDYNLLGKYDVKPYWVSPMPHQVGYITGNIFRVTKGWGATNQVNALIKLLNERKNQKTIVYIRYHESREFVEKHLTTNSINFVSIHGRIHSVEERKRLLKTFNSGDCNVLITSITSSINISADTVIMYEYTTYVKQIIGRAHRGLKPKNLEIIFILTRDTKELDYFMKYIYYRSELIQSTIGKDYSEFIALGKEVKEQMYRDNYICEV